MIKSYAKVLAALLAFVLVLPSGIGAGKAAANTVEATGEIIIEHHFENDTQGWIMGGSGTVKHVLQPAYEGQGSLLAEGRTANWNGPLFNLAATRLLEKEAIYEISAYVKLKEGIEELEEQESLQFTVRQTGAANEYVNVGIAEDVGSDDWVLVKGQYTYDREATDLQIYLESPTSETAAYYMDKFIVKLIQAGPGNPGEVPTGDSIFYDFEDGTTMGWTPRGAEKVSVTDEAAYTGSFSLKAHERTEAWNGPSKDVKELLLPDLMYHISAFVRLESTPDSPSTLKLTMENKAGDTEETAYTSLASRTVEDTGWVELQGTFRYSGSMDVLRLYIEASNVSDQFYVDDVSISSSPAIPTDIQTDIPALKEVYRDYFEIGAAVEPVQLTGIHAKLLDRHYNSLVAENAMKPSSINPSPNVFNWTGADRIRDYARDNGMNLRFHTLVWHEQGADWMLKDDQNNELEATAENKQLVLERLETYLRQVVARYKDDVRDWDVVNEVIDENGPGGMRNSAWYRLTGLDFIRTAFKVTREVAGEDAKLYINDYGTHNPRKRDILYNLAVQLREEGIPIDGVGHQTHINVTGPSIDLIADSIRKFGEAGFDNQLTELDVSVYSNEREAYTVVPEELLLQQGHRYKELFQELKALDLEGKQKGMPGGWISNVTLWGIADDHSWLHNRPITRRDAPFPFDEKYKAKPAYWGMVDDTVLPVSPRTAKAVQGAPVTLGVNDPAWGPVPYVRSDKNGDLQVSFKTLWNGDRLYVQADVSDSTIQQDDKVELFLHDGDTGASLVLARGGVNSKEMVGGYRVEGELQLAAAGAHGKQIQFDIRATDAGNGGNSEQGGTEMVSWSDTRNKQHIDRLSYGILTLAPAISVGHAFKGTPVIDGELDDIWKTAPELSTGVWVQGTAGATARFKTLWDEQHLYVYAVVSDTGLSDRSANPWEQDSIEIFIDQNNAKTTVYESDDGQYRINFRNVATVGGFAQLDHLVSAVKVLKDDSGADIGYAVEAAIKLPAISPSEGLHIGFDLQVNDDSNDDGVRDSVAIWTDASGQSYADTSGLGVLRLNVHPQNPEEPQAPVYSGGWFYAPAVDVKDGIIYPSTALTKGTAAAAVTEQQLREALGQVDPKSEPTVIGIELKKVDGATAYELKLPALDLESGEAVTLEIRTSNGILTLPGKLLEDAALEGLRDVTILLAAAALPEESKGGDNAPDQQGNHANAQNSAEWLAEVGERPILKIGLKAGGKELSHKLAQYPYTVVIPYQIAQEEAGSPHRLVVLRLNENGSVSPVVNSLYRAEDQGLVFRSNDSGLFAVAYIHPKPDAGHLSEWAREAVETMTARGVLTNSPNEAVDRSAEMNRGDFIKMLVDALELKGTEVAIEAFDDVSTSDSRYEAIRVARGLGIATGVGGNRFVPEGELSRQDMIVLTHRALLASGKLSGHAALEGGVGAELERYSDYHQVRPYARESTVILLSLDVLNGMDGKLAPQRKVSVEQAIVVLYRIWKMT